MDQANKYGTLQMARRPINRSTGHQFIHECSVKSEGRFRHTREVQDSIFLEIKELRKQATQKHGNTRSPSHLELSGKEGEARQVTDRKEREEERTPKHLEAGD